MFVCGFVFTVFTVNCIVHSLLHKRAVDSIPIQFASLDCCVCALPIIVDTQCDVDAHNNCVLI